MNDLAMALGWKFDHAAGISTRDAVITSWPEGLGPEPDAAQQTLIVNEYRVFKKEQEISDHAEQLISQGVDIPGVGIFKARDGDIARLTGMLEEARLAEAAAEAVSITFRTSAGTTVTVASSAEIEALYRTVAGFVSGVLAKSAALQGSLAALTAAEIEAFDVTDPVHWA